ncbi:MAG: polysaccharide biosynthesis protein [Planctomycetes bacterium]|nr:polysaccharide biosynthesis protein [Planctomycetota bacterium]
MARSWSWRNALKLVLDLLVLSGAYGLACVFRYEDTVSPAVLNGLRRSLVYVILLQYLWLAAWQVPRVSWRYFGLLDVKRTFWALLLANGMAACSLWNINLLTKLFPGGHFYGVPRGVILIDLVLALGGVIGLRVVLRMLLEGSHRQKYRTRASAQVPTVLIGAGSVGAEVVKEIAHHPELGMAVVGFLDDDPNKTGRLIQGIRVLGQVTRAAEVAERFRVRQALITIGKPSGEQVRRILDICKEANIAAKIIPALCYILDGKVNLSAVREVGIEDLLTRDPVTLDRPAIIQYTGSRTMLVTGAGGSIGAELCRTICRFGGTRLVLVEQAENNLFHVHRELTRKYPAVTVVPCIADICDLSRMQFILVAYRPDVLFHAAAHKHVPMMECNVGEAVKNNIFGTRTLGDLADRHGVSEFVMISTDKAVNPTSVMGVSKRIAEIYLQALSQRSRTRFVTVRFGNVLGSAGSVIPIFQEQIRQGGPLTITHPDMCRYFMTIPEACELVLQAATMGRGGEIFILDMGQPVKILDLARDLIRLSGLSPEDIEIRYTGLRPGEKLFEELALDEEVVEKTKHAKIFIGKLPHVDRDSITRHLEELQNLVDAVDAETILHKLQCIVPEYRTPRILPAQPTPVLKPDFAQALESWRQGAKQPGRDSSGEGERPPFSDPAAA